MKRLFGVYRARVVDNDDSTEDHAQYAAIKVEIPEVHGTVVPKTDLPWAYPAMPFGNGKTLDGFDYCSIIIPPIDTWVFVLFEHGDPDRPIYFAGWIGGEATELPEMFKEDTRSETIYPEIKGGTIGFSGGSFSWRVIGDRRLEIFFDEDNIIEIDSEGDSPNEEKQICVRSDWLVRLVSDKEVRLEAPKIVIEAGTELEVTSGGTSELGGSGTTTLRGSTLKGKGTVLGTLKHPI